MCSSGTNCPWTISKIVQMWRLHHNLYEALRSFLLIVLHHILSLKTLSLMELLGASYTGREFAFVKLQLLLRLHQYFLKLLLLVPGMLFLCSYAWFFCNHMILVAHCHFITEKPCPSKMVGWLCLTHWCLDGISVLELELV